MSRALPAIVVLLAANAAATAQRDFSNVQIKAIPAAGSIHMLEGSGGNIGVSVGADGILIVDDQFAPLADKIRAALGTLGQGKLKFVLNTHWHGDHTGGNVAFGPEAPIIAHTNVRKRLSTQQHLMGRTVESSPPEALPVITFDESLSIHFNGEEIKAIHFPHGHTDGDTVVFFTGSNVVHMGDDFFSGTFPFVDLASGGSVQGLTENIKKVMKQMPDDVKIIPGHGPLSTKEDLKAFHSMLVKTSAIVKERIAAGKTLDQVKSEGLPEQWKDWGGGFISTSRWLEIVFNSLSNDT